MTPPHPRTKPALLGISLLLITKMLHNDEALNSQFDTTWVTVVALPRAVAHQSLVLAGG